MKKKLLKTERFKLRGTKTLVLVILFVFSIFFDAMASVQNSVVTLDVKNASVKEFIDAIQKSSKLNIVYISSDIDLKERVAYKCKDKQVTEVLSESLVSLGLSFKIQNETITIFKNNTPSVPQAKLQADTLKGKKVVVKGKVIQRGTKKPIVGATVIVVGTTIGAISDEKGAFTFNAKDGQEYEATFVGMKPTKGIIFGNGLDLVILMDEDALAVEDVIVTGIYSRSKESFTGSAAVYTNKELKRVGNSNVLQSLKTLDPSFAIVDNNLYGSDPNRMPDVEVRGKTSVQGLASEYKTDPNQPLFILDGFETTLSVIRDMSMDRIQSIVVLKDAAATGIYGSKAANGVVIVETIPPEPGKLRLNYSGNFALAFADLSAYNLMNAKEKIEFEKLSGYYGVIRQDGSFASEDGFDRYNIRNAEIQRGVDSYWMNEPLRNSFRHTHAFNVDGGDPIFRYGVNFSYGDNKGVMKNSGRETMSGNVKLVYRTTKLSVTNNLTINYVSSTREKEPFSSFSGTNPFFRKYDKEGNIVKILERYISTDTGKELFVYNPLYNASLGSFTDGSDFGFTNNTELEWAIRSDLKARVRFGISKAENKSTNFKSPLHTDFDGMNKIERGLFTRTDASTLSYDGDFTLTYAKNINEKHLINALVGSRLTENDNLNTGYIAKGFIDDSYFNPAFSTGYVDGKPAYQQSTARSASFYFNGGYAFDNRYMVDLNMRLDGSSVFGASKRFTNTWSAGLSWNIHKEKFMEDVDWLNVFKIRATIGNPGNQNFDAYISMKTYTYNNDLQNHFGLSSIISSLGNSNLEWQKTIDKNFGVDFSLFDTRLVLTFDIFNKKTDPLLVNISVPSSTGATSIPFNVGNQTINGYTISANYHFIKQSDKGLSINANLRRLTSAYGNIGNSLDKFNKDNQSKSTQRYYDGGSNTAIWAVRSAGIDPITGREIFIKKDGTQTFVHDYNDEVMVGNTTPKIEGVIGSSFYYKGFQASFSLRYKVGADVFMESLYGKVENISNISIRYNQDKRALYDRWKNPGDEAKFKSLSLTDKTPMSSRFVEKENIISGESISVGYESTAEMLKKFGVQALTFKVYMNDIFRISSVKTERGLEYPFERSFSFSLGLRF